MAKDTSKGSSSAPAVAIRALQLDLKGVPPTHHRLLGLLELTVAAKYNAILVEWEDMFPWTVDSRFRCETAYTPAQVRAFHDAALRQGLEVIPLVQCLGHMETPLSVSDYKHLREVPYRSDGLDPLAKGARELVERMIDDVLALSPGVRYFHLGGDEARTLGMNPQTAAYVKAHGKGQLYLQHVEPILDRLAARNIRPILWSDMFHDWSDADIKHIASKADLCPWGYGGKPDDWQNHHSATKYIKRFHENGAALWGATAYKGATAHNADLCDFAQQQENALAWTDVAKRFAMKGLIATAWSRHATDRTQTQPIDACLDSLVNVGLILHNAKAPGQEACMDILRQTCDDARFMACKTAMSKLAQLRQWAWDTVSDLREQIVLETADPRRRESGMAMSALIDLKRHLEVGGPEAYSMTRTAFAGLIEPIWIERYLQDRIEPLMEELGSLDSRVRVLEPQAYKATIHLRSWNQAH